MNRNKWTKPSDDKTEKIWCDKCGSLIGKMEISERPVRREIKKMMELHGGKVLRDFCEKCHMDLTNEGFNNIGRSFNISIEEVNETE